MIELRTLGGLELLQLRDGVVRAIPLQTKRLTLLAYLAAHSPDGFCRRDTLLALFWPELDQEHARGALRQALHFLRKAIGEGALRNRGEDEVGLDRAALQSDAQLLEAALVAGEPEAALAWYRGDFLEGVFVTDGSSDLEDWMAAERTRLRGVAARAAWMAAERPTGQGNTGGYIRRAIHLSGDDERALRRGLTMLDRMGDHAGVTALYQDFASRVARDLEVGLSAETQAMIEQVRARRVAPTGRPAPPPTPTLPLIEADVSVAGAPAGFKPRSRQRRWYLAGGVGALCMVAIAAALGWGRTPTPPALDADAVAVLPFRVTPAEPGSAWMQDGMAELFSNRLAGAAGVRVVDPGKLLVARREGRAGGDTESTDDALRGFAAKSGAGWVVEGIVVAAPAFLVLKATLRSVPEGTIVAQAEVQGPPDSLSTLIDHLAARLLGARLGMQDDRLASLTSPSFAATRAFLTARSAFRRGEYEAAARGYREAVTLDPAFALAGLELARTSERAGGRQGWNLGMRIARAGRDQLSAADRALLDAMEGVLEDGPEMFRRRNAAVSANPEWPEVWYALGNTYLHYGRLSGQQDALARAERAYRRGWQLDSAAVGRGVLVAAPIGHLVELAHIREDTAEVRRLVARVLAADSSSDLARTVRWHVAVLDGEDARRRYWDQIDLASQQTTMEVALFITWTGIGAADFPVAAAADIRRLTTHDPGYAGYALRTYAANRGRPHDAPDEPPTSAIEARKLLRDRLRAGLWWDGDSLAAAAALGALQLPFSAPGEWRAAAGEGYEDLCAVSLWRAVHGHQAAVTEASARLRAARVPGLARSDSLSLAHFGGLCAALLDATRAGSLGLPGAAGALATADSLAITHLSQACCDRLPEANLLLAKLWEAQGDLPRALQALRRTGGQFLRGPSLLSTFFREEGRVAALTGDTTGAVRAWRQYLALRPDPEPHLRPGVDSVRQAMSALDKR